MKTIYFTPGPSQLYPTAAAHFHKGLKTHIGSISHRSKGFQEIYLTLTEGLKKLLTIPDNYHIFIVGSGTEAMERVIQHCVEKETLHLVNGSFSKRFFTTAQELGKKPKIVAVLSGEGVNLAKMKIPAKTELLCFTHNETSTGVMLSAKEIENLARKNRDVLIAVDIVSSAPYADLDYPLMDVVFFSIQKGFGMPAGLGVMIVSPRAMQKAESMQAKGMSTGSYHSFVSLVQFAEKQQTPETPPVLAMYVLGKIIQDMLAVGIATIRRETEEKAQMLYNFFDTSTTLSAFVKDKKFRSATVIVADVQNAKGDVKKLLAQKGFLVGSGYGANKTNHIRIANFPAHSVKDVKKLLKELKAL